MRWMASSSQIPGASVVLTMTGRSLTALRLLARGAHQAAEIAVPQAEARAAAAAGPPREGAQVVDDVVHALGQIGDALHVLDAALAGGLGQARQALGDHLDADDAARGNRAPRRRACAASAPRVWLASMKRTSAPRDPPSPPRNGTNQPRCCSPLTLSTPPERTDPSTAGPAAGVRELELWLPRPLQLRLRPEQRLAERVAAQAARASGSSGCRPGRQPRGPTPGARRRAPP